MNINVDVSELSWLINGVEVEMDANKSHRKDEMPDSDRKELETSYDDMSKLLEKLKARWPEPSDRPYLTERQFEAARLVNDVQKEYEWAIGLSYETYLKMVKSFSDGRQYDITCAIGPTHDIGVWMRGVRTVSNNTGEEIDSEIDDEVYTCLFCKTSDTVVQDSDLQEFEALL